MSSGCNDSNDGPIGCPRQDFSSCSCPVEDLREVFNEFEPGSADVDGTAEADAASLGSSEVRRTGAPAAASLGGGRVEVSAGSGTRCLLFALI